MKTSNSIRQKCLLFLSWLLIFSNESALASPFKCAEAFKSKQRRLFSQNFEDLIIDETLILHDQRILKADPWGNRRDPETYVYGSNGRTLWGSRRQKYAEEIVRYELPMRRFFRIVTQTGSAIKRYSRDKQDSDLQNALKTNRDTDFLTDESKRTLRLWIARGHETHRTLKLVEAFLEEITLANLHYADPKSKITESWLEYIRKANQEIRADIRLFERLIISDL